MTELFRHLRESGNTKGYFKHLVWRHRRVLAYVFLALFTAYAVFLSTQYSDKLAAQGKVARAERTDAILIALAQSSFAGCVNNNNTLVEPLRVIISDGVQQSRATIRNLVKDGTFTEAQGKRFIADNERSARVNLSRIKYRNCSDAADRFILKITDPIERARLRGSYAELELGQERLRTERNAP